MPRTFSIRETDARDARLFTFSTLRFPLPTTAPELLTTRHAYSHTYICDRDDFLKYGTSRLCFSTSCSRFCSCGSLLVTEFAKSCTSFTPLSATSFVTCMFVTVSFQRQNWGSSSHWHAQPRGMTLLQGREHMPGLLVNEIGETSLLIY